MMPASVVTPKLLTITPGIKLPPMYGSFFISVSFTYFRYIFIFIIVDEGREIL